LFWFVLIKLQSQRRW